jgi:hypothetical protein
MAEPEEAVAEAPPPAGARRLPGRLPAPEVVDAAEPPTAPARFLRRAAAAALAVAVVMPAPVAPEPARVARPPPVVVVAAAAAEDEAVVGRDRRPDVAPGSSIMACRETGCVKLKRVDAKGTHVFTAGCRRLIGCPLGATRSR